jgi:hypothetical protein
VVTGPDQNVPAVEVWDGPNDRSVRATPTGPGPRSWTVPCAPTPTLLRLPDDLMLTASMQAVRCLRGR